LNSKHPDALEKEKNKVGHSAEYYIRRNLLKIKRLKNPNAEVMSQDIRNYIGNANKHPFPLDAGRRRQDGGKLSTIVQQDHTDGSQSQNDMSRDQDRSGSEAQDEEKSSLRDRKSKSSVSKIN
jgi:hypothetical protein